jgi:hypothetical protein
VHDYLLKGLRAGPIAIERLVGAIATSDHDVAKEQGRFTPREVVAHLADWEPIMRGRIEQAVNAPGTVIPAYDEGQMAIDNNYAGSDINAQCTLWKGERAKTAEYVASLKGDDLQKSVTHPERGVQTVEDLANMLLGHDMYHVEQLTAYLR